MVSTSSNVCGLQHTANNLSGSVGCSGLNGSWVSLPGLGDRSGGVHSLDYRAAGVITWPIFPHLIAYALNCWGSWTPDLSSAPWKAGDTDVCVMSTGLYPPWDQWSGPGDQKLEILGGECYQCLGSIWIILGVYLLLWVFWRVRHYILLPYVFKSILLVQWEPSFDLLVTWGHNYVHPLGLSCAWETRFIYLLLESPWLRGNTHSILIYCPLRTLMNEVPLYLHLGGISWKNSCSYLLGGISPFHLPDGWII